MENTLAVILSLLQTTDLSQYSNAEVQDF